MERAPAESRPDATPHKGSSKRAYAAVGAGLSVCAAALTFVVANMTSWILFHDPGAFPASNYGRIDAVGLILFWAIDGTVIAITALIWVRGVFAPDPLSPLALRDP